MHPALPVELAADWAELDATGHEDDRQLMLGTLVEAHAQLGTYLMEQLSSGDAGQVLARIGLTLRNLGRMLGHALDAQEWGSAQKILQPLNDFWDTRGLVVEARGWVERVRLATESPDGAPPTWDSPAGGLWLFAVGFPSQPAAAGAPAR